MQFQLHEDVQKSNLMINAWKQGVDNSNWIMGRPASVHATLTLPTQYSQQTTTVEDQIVARLRRKVGGSYVSGSNNDKKRRRKLKLGKLPAIK